MFIESLTLIELLAVIAILSIVSTFAVISISRVIQDSKDRAFVGNAFALKESANLFLKSELIHESVPPEVISYQTLYETGFLDEFKDPDTGRYPESSVNSFV
ncbi:type II secretion system protein [Neobacillus drentensis]|uniref:type II secretion system protein n=1 Tax=Neobacillus drentensis TaxID=220684 RepID=UPI003000B037